MAASKKEVPQSSGAELTSKERVSLAETDLFLSQMQARDEERASRMDRNLKALTEDITWLEKNDPIVEAQTRSLEAETVAELDQATLEFLASGEPEEKQEK